VDRRRLGTALAVALAVVLGAVVLWPNGEQVRRVILDVYLFFLHRGVPGWVTPEWYANALNILVVVPLGWLGVVALRQPPVRVVALLAGASALVETLQLLPALHREASLLDVACNAAGALVGAWLGSVAVRRGGVDVQHAGSHQLVEERRDVGSDELD
jgi:glycopeptide antibiotics resistance protein